MTAGKQTEGIIANSHTFRSRYSVAWQYAGKEFWVRDHGPAVEIHFSTKRIHVL